MNNQMVRGQLYGLGVGPGDPELITVKALRRLRESQVVAYMAAKGKKGNSLSIVEQYLSPGQILLPMIYPVTTEKLPPPFSYEDELKLFYDEQAALVAEHLNAGRNVAAICEGDPFFYGSFMYLHDRLAEGFDTEVIPGVCSMLACASVLGVPLVYRNQVLTILSGVMTGEELLGRLQNTEAAAIMKLGSNFAKAREAVQNAGLMERALYVERATMSNQRIVALAEIDPDTVPYFAMILIPGPRWVA
jgi:precorrin-2/cobalt-factor-2 C20-methyltransferase